MNKIIETPAECKTHQTHEERTKIPENGMVTQRTANET